MSNYKSVITSLPLSNLTEEELISRKNDLVEISKNINLFKTKINKMLSTIEWTPTGVLHHHHRKTSSHKLESTKNEITIDLRTKEQKLYDYEQALSKLGHFTEPELSILVNEEDGDHKILSSKGNQQSTMTFAEITKLKRDRKRRRMKYRTTKEPPLSHTEEIRALIALQMESWQQYLKQIK